MKRNMRKAIADYKKRYGGKTNAEGAFFCVDIAQIAEISGGVDKTYNLIENSLFAGFMIGYRKAQRDYRKRNRQRQTKPLKEALEALTMKDTDIGKLARFGREQMGDEEVADMIDSIIRGAGESAKAPDITPLDKLYYIARESYTKGYMVALYLSNEAVKEAIAQLQEA